MILPFLHPRALTIERYAFDAASAEERRRVSAHLLRCPRCRREVQTIQRMAAAAGMPRRGAPREVLDRVLADRAAGRRVILPVAGDDPPRVRTITGGAVGAFAAAAAALILASILYDARPTRGLASGSLGSGFLVSEATARVVSPTSVPNVSDVDGSRLRAGVWRFVEHRTDGAGHAIRGDTLDLGLTAGTEGTRAVWRVSSSGTSQSETMVVDRRSLEPVSRMLHVGRSEKFDRLDIDQKFSGDAFTAHVVGNARGRPTFERTVTRSIPRGAPPRVSDAIAPLYFGATPLDAHWSGRVALVGWAIEKSDVLHPVTLAVRGVERVRTPAGTFACWRLDVQVGAQTQVCWVRQVDGIAVRSRRVTEKGTREWLLVRE